MKVVTLPGVNKEPLTAVEHESNVIILCFKTILVETTKVVKRLLLQIMEKWCAELRQEQRGWRGGAQEIDSEKGDSTGLGSKRVNEE